MATDTFTVSVDNVAVLETVGEDVFIGLGGLADLQIAAGSEITFAAGGPVATSSFRIETFTVDVVPAVPEPSSMLAIAGVAGLFVARRRRR